MNIGHKIKSYKSQTVPQFGPKKTQTFLFTTGDGKKTGPQIQLHFWNWV